MLVYCSELIGAQGRNRSVGKELTNRTEQFARQKQLASKVATMKKTQIPQVPIAMIIDPLMEAYSHDMLLQILILDHPDAGYPEKIVAVSP